jgi:putative hydrolase of the HAD superfamily
MPPQQIDIIAFDADDTLWHNEQLYLNAIDRFIALLSRYHQPDWISERLEQTQLKNLDHFGYGIKAFALTMIETAVELTEGRLSGEDVKVLIDEAKKMINAKVELLIGVSEVIPKLAARYPLMLITKGDLLDQERKIALSGLRSHFTFIEITAAKNRDVYQQIFQKHAINPSRVLMVGNSPKSDIIPILELGGYAVHSPYATTWAHEAAVPPPDNPRYFQLTDMSALPGLLDSL